MMYVILDNIRSAYNVGAIFRTADGAGVTKLFLSGYTATPLDRFGRVQGEIHKTSLGASETVPWEQVSDVTACVTKLKAEGVTIVAVEQTEVSVSLASFVMPEATAFVFGNEIDGVSSEWLAAADVVVELPMLGHKESLNVAVTAGVVLYRPLI